MKIKTSTKFGNISKEGYRHFPLLYFAYGSDGFIICILGFCLTIKL